MNSLVGKIVNAQGYGRAVVAQESKQDTLVYLLLPNDTTAWTDRSLVTVLDTESESE